MTKLWFLPKHMTSPRVVYSQQTMYCPGHRRRKTRCGLIEPQTSFTQLLWKLPVITRRGHTIISSFINSPWSNSAIISFFFLTHSVTFYCWDTTIYFVCRLKSQSRGICFLTTSDTQKCPKPIIKLSISCFGFFFFWFFCLFVCLFFVFFLVVVVFFLGLSLVLESYIAWLLWTQMN